MDLALRLERLEDRHLFAAIPAISGVGGTRGVLLGESVSLGFNFQNGSTTDTGFSPFLEIAVDTSGPDGATSLPLDGIGTIAVTSTGLPLTPIGTVTLVAGQTTWTNPFTSQTRPVPAGFGARDTIYVYALPFGSFTPNQTTAVTLSASTSNFADVGTAMRATGDNPQMVRALGADVDRYTILGLALSNGLVALSGALLAQYQGFADAQMGIGMIVWGLASVIIGEALTGTRSLGLALAGAVLGSVLFRLLVAVALRWGLNPNDLKLITALFVFSALVLPRLLARRRGGAPAA